MLLHELFRQRLRWMPGLAMLALGACGGGDGGLGGGVAVENFPIAYVKRSVDVEAMDQVDVRNPLEFNAGADLYVRDLAAPGASDRNVTLRVTGGAGDVKDVEASFDGARLIFALRLPEIEGADPEDQPTWNIWEYEFATDTLRRVIASDTVAEAGQDVAPHYLPDGRIVFSSTRQRQASALLLDEGKPQFAALDEDLDDPAAVLHVMNADGSDIHQISFNQSHDLDPAVLDSGEIVFSRWDHMGGRNAVSLYRVRPDGTELQPFYGVHSHDTGTNGATVQFLAPRPTRDGRIMSLLKPFTGTRGGGDIVLVDIDNYIDNEQPVIASQGILTGPGQVSIAASQIRTDGEPSPGGYFSAAYPLWDGTNRALVSWTLCRLLEDEVIVPCTDERLADPEAEEAPPLYGIYVLDMDNDTLRPLTRPEEGVMYTEVVAMQSRALPDILLDKQTGVDLDGTLADEGAGVIDIRTVYDFDGVFNNLGSGAASIAAVADPAQTLAADRPARFLRVVKAVGIPDEDVREIPNTAFGRSTQQRMREIVAYAPIEPDGSVKIKVPANVPLALSVLDGDGRRIGARHQYWIQVRPGETVTCNGCHSPASEAGHGHAQGPASIYAGATSTGVPFPNTESALFTDFAETMAQTRTRIDVAALQPSMDIIYDDVWTDETAAGRAKDTSFAWRYADLATPAPVSTECQTAWNSLCRIIINYEDHIHPLWGRDRGANTCSACHGTLDAMNNPQVPAAQLDLGDGPSDAEPDHFKSYRELLFPDNEQELVAGVLVDVQVQATDGMGNPLFETDANGDPILDGDGNPIPVLVTVGVNPTMSTAGARASTAFFDLFDAGGSHAGFLDPAELKLIAEWLDIGAQYYNNPFDVPPP
ncbi:MAG: hypothetical protein IPM20_09835 [Gammaproteobacteria bacterium]|nr:hypothetical protein [Gammaproteobacteria bacterium]